MKRMFGLIESDKVKIQKSFRDPAGLKVIIQAADGGYSILFADHSSQYADNDLSAEENFNIAHDKIVEIFGEVIIEDDFDYDIDDIEDDEGECCDDEEDGEDAFYEKSKFLDAIEKVKNFVYFCADAEGIIKDKKNNIISEDYARELKEAADYVEEIALHARIN